MKAEAHKARYMKHKDFLQNGITDKYNDNYSGWYITGMYFAIYHLTCHYCARHEKPIPPPAKLDIEYDNSNLSTLAIDLVFISNCKQKNLYDCLLITAKEVSLADTIFPKFEQKLLAG